MPRLALLALLVLAGASCMNVARAINGQPNPDITWIRDTAAPVIGCPAKDIAVLNDSDVRGYGWTATGCGKSAACEGSWEKWKCVPLPRPWWEGTDDEPAVQAGIARLSLETGCAAEKIEALAKAETVWVRGNRRAGDDVAVRMRACGKAYVCAMADGRTDCKAALDDQASESADAGSEIRDGGL